MSGLFADLVGQNQAVALLEAALKHRRLAPAYLFAGPNGVGRRRAALRFLEGVLAGPTGSPALRRRLEEGNHPRPALGGAHLFGKGPAGTGFEGC